MISLRTALKVILVISIAGILFSGYLSISELSNSDPIGLSCSGGDEAGKLLGIPVCVYGLVMYIVIFLVSAMSLFDRSKK